MTLQEQFKKDLVSAMKDKDDEKKSAIRIIMGEFGRSGKKELSDDDVIKVLKKLIKSERETLEIKGDATESQYIKIIENYLPKTPSKEEIKAWVIDNIDFSQFKNKMQAMKPIMKHFGASADGNTVKTILQDI